jgi:hypothetical protein
MRIPPGPPATVVAGPIRASRARRATLRASRPASGSSGPRRGRPGQQRVRAGGAILIRRPARKDTSNQQPRASAPASVPAGDAGRPVTTPGSSSLSRPGPSTARLDRRLPPGIDARWRARAEHSGCASRWKVRSRTAGTRSPLRRGCAPNAHGSSLKDLHCGWPDLPGLDSGRQTRSQCVPAGQKVFRGRGERPPMLPHHERHVDRPRPERLLDARASSSAPGDAHRSWALGPRVARAVPPSSARPRTARGSTSTPGPLSPPRASGPRGRLESARSPRWRYTAPGESSLVAARAPSPGREHRGLPMVRRHPSRLPTVPRGTEPDPRGRARAFPPGPFLADLRPVSRAR